jgi:hypothetical protein
MKKTGRYIDFVKAESGLSPTLYLSGDLKFAWFI